MANVNVSAATASDLTSEFKTRASDTVSATYKVPAVGLDSPSDIQESTWSNTKWTTWLGYYKQIPELRSAIDTYASWVVGKGFTADEMTILLLDGITGWGKDNIISILKNLVITFCVGGDSYAEQVRDGEGVLINLKPLSPDGMQHVVDNKGRIIRYEQLNRSRNGLTVVFQPEEIFHLARNRIGDEMHGQSIIEAVEPLILMRNEAMADWKRVLHRNVEPLWIFHMDTDDTVKIAAFKAKMDAARGKGENMYIPLGAVKPELVAAGSNLTPLPWVDLLNQYFYQSVGVPDIVTGSSKILTEASAKIAYLSYGQGIEFSQRDLEEAFRIQLNLIINMVNPVRIQNEALQSVEVQPAGQAVEPNDMTAKFRGRR